MKKLIIYSGLFYFCSSALAMETNPQDETKEKSLQIALIRSNSAEEPSDVACEHQAKSTNHIKLTPKIKGYYDSTENLCPFENDPQRIVANKAMANSRETILTKAAVIAANFEADTKPFVK